MKDLLPTFLRGLLWALVPTVLVSATLWLADVSRLSLPSLATLMLAIFAPLGIALETARRRRSRPR